MEPFQSNQIICIGNRLVAEDAAGLLVYDKLRQYPLPKNIELVEGGIAGLDLLPRLERGGRIVFVDTVAGFAPNGQLVVLDQETIVSQNTTPHYGHDAGVSYLLALLPHVCEGPPPEAIYLVGLEGVCSDQVIEKAAALSLSLATNR